MNDGCGCGGGGRRLPRFSLTAKEEMTFASVRAPPSSSLAQTPRLWTESCSKRNPIPLHPLHALPPNTPTAKGQAVAYNDITLMPVRT